MSTLNDDNHETQDEYEDRKEQHEIDTLEPGDYVHASVLVRRADSRGHGGVAVWVLRCRCGELYTMQAIWISDRVSRKLPVHCDECTDVECDPMRAHDRESCVHYPECLGEAARVDAGHVCTVGCTRYERITRPMPTLVMSTMGWCSTYCDGEEE